MSRSITIGDNIRPIFAAIRSVPIPSKSGPTDLPRPVVPFVTISREAGAGAWSLAQQVVESMNADNPGGELWTCWDRELVGKVAVDCHISRQLIEALEDAHHTWLSDYLGSLSFSDSGEAADEARVYGRVAATIRALAQAGRVVIVGRGGVFITRKMPGGIHVRLVAPLENRIAYMARQHNMNPKQAAAYVAHLDHNRQAFYRRYWPNEMLLPHNFSITMNTALVDTPTMIQTIKSLVRAPVMA